MQNEEDFCIVYRRESCQRKQTIQHFAILLLYQKHFISLNKSDAIAIAIATVVAVLFIM